KPLTTRPQFMQEKVITPQEKGTAMHMVMQHLDLSIEPSASIVAKEVARLEAQEILTPEEANSIDLEAITNFLTTEIAERMRTAHWLKREVPFSLALSPAEIYPDWEGDNDLVFIQGIIDCLFEDENGLVLVDYKTDRITGRFPTGFAGARPVLLKRYRTQIHLYQKAIETILQRKLQADRKSTRLNSSHVKSSYAVFCVKKKKLDDT